MALRESRGGGEVGGVHGGDVMGIYCVTDEPIFNKNKNRNNKGEKRKGNLSLFYQAQTVRGNSEFQSLAVEERQSVCSISIVVGDKETWRLPTILKRIQSKSVS